jgi:hypothetical protein
MKSGTAWAENVERCIERFIGAEIEEMETK